MPQSTLEERCAELDAALTPEHLRAFEGDRLISHVVKSTARAAQNQQTVRPALVHNDYWPGNILWRRRRISAIVDWTEASLGDPARDVAQFQIDLSLMFGVENAARFAQLYSVAAQGLPPNLRYVQLFGIRSALAHLEDWYLPGYVDLGMKHTLLDLQTRFREYIRWVLD